MKLDLEEKDFLREIINFKIINRKDIEERYGFNRLKYMLIKFNEILKSIGEEKRLGKEFESVSGYSLYRVVQMSKNASKRIKMEQ